MSVFIDIDRLSRELETLAGISEHPAPAVTRVLFSEEDLRARAWFRDRCDETGFTCREDEVGNVFVRWQGSDESLTAVATGSHIDAIPHAGKYDGTVGVLGGLEAMRALKRSGFVPRRSIELIAFTAEEPTRFGVGCLGSRLLSGAMTPEEAGVLRDDETGQGLDAWRARAGHAGELATVRLPEGCYSAFIELHIEQGPLLEERGLDIGVVEKIAAPAAFRLRLTGSGGHAGAVLMPGRRDAGLAAAEIALAVECAALGTSSPDTVATTGVMEIKPGAINSIPCLAKLEIDLRDTDPETRNDAEAAIRRAVEEICARRRIECEWQTIHSDPPAHCDQTLVALAESHAVDLGFGVQRMISRAYHDSLFMARLAPATMIFIPCHRGYSHRPDEFSSPEAIRRGVAVLTETLRSLSA